MRKYNRLTDKTFTKHFYRLIVGLIKIRLLYKFWHNIKKDKRKEKSRIVIFM